MSRSRQRLISTGDDTGDDSERASARGGVGGARSSGVDAGVFAAQPTTTSSVHRPPPRASDTSTNLAAR